MVLLTAFLYFFWLFNNLSSFSNFTFIKQTNKKLEFLLCGQIISRPVTELLTHTTHTTFCTAPDTQPLILRKLHKKLAPADKGLSS